MIVISGYPPSISALPILVRIEQAYRVSGECPSVIAMNILERITDLFIDIGMAHWYSCH